MEKSIAALDAKMKRDSVRNLNSESLQEDEGGTERGRRLFWLSKIRTQLRELYIAKSKHCAGLQVRHVEKSRHRSAAERKRRGRLGGKETTSSRLVVVGGNGRWEQCRSWPWRMMG